MMMGTQSHGIHHKWIQLGALWDSPRFPNSTEYGNALHHSSKGRILYIYIYNIYQSSPAPVQYYIGQ